MTPTIITKGIKAGEAMQDYVMEKLKGLMSYSQDSIRSVTVRLSDTNRIKKGMKKRCLVHLELPGLPSSVVTKFASEVQGAVDSAMHHASGLLNKTLSKVKDIPHTTLPLYFNKPWLLAV